MSFFSSLLQAKNLSRHDGRPLWKYMLSPEDFNRLVEKLSLVHRVAIDPRDAALYFAEWWKNNYEGGKPSKQEIFDSLGRKEFSSIDQKEFYKLAKQGARILGVKWLTKQNTLYFRSLLLQGGLPLSHISKNQSNYQNFLQAVLDEQPETIEDFSFNPQIIKLLPVSSQNDIIYENCLEIVKSILKGGSDYDELLSSNDAIHRISESLKVRKQKLKSRSRSSKPRNYWLLSFKKQETRISLRIGLADTYKAEDLSNNILGFDATGKEYQLYVNEELICVFRKMISGEYKTDWYQQQNQEWEGESNLPYTYVIRDGKKIELRDFIQTVPNLHEPSLWAKYSDNEWRLIKGNGTTNKEAAILFPNDWVSDFTAEEISLYDKKMSWLPFEGEAEIKNADESQKYLSEVKSFDWTIVSQKPAWMQKANMSVIRKDLKINVYDENNKLVLGNRIKTWIRKHNSKEVWEDLSSLEKIPLGCIDVKIEYEGLIAYDMFYNVGNLQAEYSERGIDHAEIEIRNLGPLEFKLDESLILEILGTNNTFSLQVKTEYSKIPTGVKGSVGYRRGKKLYFEMASPFQGMAITDKEGRIIADGESLSLSNLYGLRILSTPNAETILQIRNGLKSDVKITKEIQEHAQPVISFKEEIERLYFLADVMNYKNKVCLELIEGSQSKIYEVSGFSHTLDVEEQLQHRVSLYDSEDDLDLFAIPLNCSPEEIELIPLIKTEQSYQIPTTEVTNQLIVISPKVKGRQLMPRFVNTDEAFIGIGKDERIDSYHAQLLEGSFEEDIWKQILVYYNLCIENDLPFSTFDQLRAISRCSQVAARAFFFLGINQEDTDSFIQRAIPAMEIDLGFCFHWIKRADWGIALNEINQFFKDQYYNKILELASSFMQENGFGEVWKFIVGQDVQVEHIRHPEINDFRSKLGERVLEELPKYAPEITKDYNIPIEKHRPVKLLLRSPIAVAESITDTQKKDPIWAGNDFRNVIRRNIQYSQYLNPDFYTKVILHVLQAK